jgi:diadenosine tetraphosphate (Ap4A) HIT family hydrolase
MAPMQRSAPPRHGFAPAHPADCHFCRLPEHRIRDRNAWAVAGRDAFPVTRGHTLVIPTRHVESFFDTTAVERQALLSLLDRAREQVQGELRPDGHTIGINDGRAAGQTVGHLHIHLIPRYAGDREDPRGGVRWVIPEKAAYRRDEPNGGH